MINRYDLQDFVEGAILIVILGVLGLVIAVGVWSLVGRNTCATLTVLDSEHDYRWTLWTGCMVRTPAGRWVQWDGSSYFDVDVGGGE